MSEKYRDNREIIENLKPSDTHESQINHEEHKLTDQEKEHGSREQLEKIAQSVEKQAVSGREYAKGEHEQPKQHPLLVNKQLKDIAFSRTLTRIRKKLSVQSRIFSKVIHNPVVDKPSEIIGKTIIRPASMLSGAVFAFIGTSTLLWVTRHYGYRYNYLVAILLFIIGALIGVITEGLWRLIKKKR